MRKPFIQTSHTRHTGQVFTILLTLAILATAVGLSASSSAAAPAHIQPLISQMASQQPNMMISVIVQKNVPDTRPEQQAINLGGQGLKSLGLINGFAVEMSAESALQLSRSTWVRWVSLDAEMKSASSNSFTSWASSLGDVVPMGFSNPANIIDSALGPNNVYGYGANASASFGGFTSEITAGNQITKVELVLSGYPSKNLTKNEDLQISAWVGGVPGSFQFIDHQVFNNHYSEQNPGQIILDITSIRNWQWADFDNNLQIVIDQSKLKKATKIYYDAVGLIVTSDGPDQAQPELCGDCPDTGGNPASLATINSTADVNYYNQIIHSSNLWNGNKKLQGRGVGIAVIDSGVFKTKDLGKRLRVSVNFNGERHNAADLYGHGTFVAGVAAGNGIQSNFKYIGVAPRADLVNVRVSDDLGMSYESDVVRGLQWVYANRNRYNIRVVNISLNSSMQQSYHSSPLDAAVEILWMNGLVVVVSAGNNGSQGLTPPANDPFVITVGATDDIGTLTTADDHLASFSAYGVTPDGITKPDLVAPGRNIISLLPDNAGLTMGMAHPDNRVNATYFRMSGTSVSAPIVSGGVALLLQSNPSLNPDQVKYRLVSSANKNWPGYDSVSAGAGYLDVTAAVSSTQNGSANTGLQPSHLLQTGSEPVYWDSVGWNSVGWNSVGWNSVGWNSVGWNSVGWNSVGWNSDYWGD